VIRVIIIRNYAARPVEFRILINLGLDVFSGEKGERKKEEKGFSPRFVWYIRIEFARVSGDEST
jgi:hypothetical protein